MATLTYQERRNLEKLFGMSSGYVLNFSNRTFEDFVYDAVQVNLYEQRYESEGTSKANRLRCFLKIEDDYVAGRLLERMVEYAAEHEEDDELVERCRQIASRLLAGGPTLAPVKAHAEELGAHHLKEQIRRMQDAVDTDPGLAIGTAKELIETYCRTILEERGVQVPVNIDLPKLTKRTFKELNLVPDGVPDTSRGTEIIRRLLSNLGTIGQGMAELRNLYGTGHGKHGKTKGLKPRHAKLAVGAAVTLVVFLFDTHQETRANAAKSN